MGTSPAIHLSTVRERNDVATTWLLEVFTRRNFVADFLSTEVEIYWKNSKIAFCATLWGLGSNVHGSSMARWKARGRLPISANCTFFVSSRLRRYEQILVEIALFERG